MKNRSASITLSLAIGSLIILQSACQRAVEDTNRDAARSANANMTKEPVDRAAIESEIMKIEREWSDTEKTHNADVVRRIVADDVVMTYPDGSTGTKADEVRDAETQALTVESWEIVDSKVTVLDADAAVMTGHSKIKNGKYKGPDGKPADISGEYRFTDVFARRNGSWQVVASQATKIANPAPAPSPTMKASPTAANNSSAPSPAPSVKTTP